MTAIPSLKEMLGALVALPSVSSVDERFDQNNIQVVETLAQWTESLGLASEVHPLPENPGKANLVATTHPEQPGGLVLAGHTDTVPYDCERWRFDPFKLTEADGRWYGLGTSDMKGFLAIVLEVASALNKRSLQKPLTILATADEESTMAGAKSLTRDQIPQGALAIIGEPTGMVPIHMHKGILMDAVEIVGLSGHSSDPSVGHNALEAMFHLIGHLLAYRDKLEAEYCHPGFDVPQPTLNLGAIEGGDNPNRICARCELRFDMRPVPGLTIRALREALRGVVANSLDGTSFEYNYRVEFDGIEPFQAPDDSQAVALMQRLSGHAPQSVAFGTEATYFQKLGLDPVVWGPGDIRQAHQPDEFLDLSCIGPTQDILRKAIQEICA